MIAVLRFLCVAITAYAAGVLLAFLLFLAVCAKLTPTNPWFVPEGWFFTVLAVAAVGTVLELYFRRSNCKIEEDSQSS